MPRLLVLALTMVLAVVGAAACGSQTVTEAPASSNPTQPRTAEQPTSPPSPSPTPTVAVVGDTLSVTGFTDDAKLAVTVVKVVDPAAGKDTRPEAGERYVAVQFRLHNTGSKTYNDAPDNSAKLIDDQGQRFNSWITETIAGPGFGGTVTIPVGDTALGYITFKVPAESKIAKIQFTMESGFADNTGQWRVP
ncbi:hypothetical protein BJP40_27695 [Streptomyces sp. CC53]|uniref:DUF4352 domain-containing protein n=1 Tax=Streptomyces sp. CC53 TaxID=1906740 RepID=UPI0008DCE863|nr:DUF4352 domain-containing protein [Streptomyces sp. CC53]OII62599.1 hypothetical protein BJP40_27695 [Streptomyces sp. CC53]